MKGKECSLTTDRIPDFPSEVNPNPVTALDAHTRDGTTLRLVLPEVQQPRFMVAIGEMCARLDVPLDFTLLPAEPTEHRPRSTPTAEWLERQIAAFIEDGIPGGRARTEYCHDLAEHLLGNWLQVESMEVEMLVRAATRAWQKAKLEYDQQVIASTGELVTDSEECWAEFEALYEALAPFQKKGAS